MRRLVLLIAAITLLSACGGSSSSGGSSDPSVSVAIETLTLTGSIDLDGASLPAGVSLPTVLVDGQAATVSAGAQADRFNWSLTVDASAVDGVYQVDCYVGAQLLASQTCTVEP